MSYFLQFCNKFQLKKNLNYFKFEKISNAIKLQLTKTQNKKKIFMSNVVCFQLLFLTKK